MSGSIQLKQSLGLMSSVSIVVGIVIGSGIFVSPKGVLQYTGSVGASLLVWLACGVITTIGALCYAELGTIFTEGGGDYIYIKRTIGELPAFLFIWMMVVAIVPAANAITAITCAIYILKPFFGHLCDPDILAVRAVAALCILTVVALNSRSVKLSAHLTTFFTAGKVLAISVIVVVGFVVLYLHYDQLQVFDEPFKGTNTHVGRFVLSFYSGLFTYSGFNFLNLLIEEMKDPYKNLPRTIMIGMPLVTIVYLLTNLAYFVVLSKEEILHSPAVALMFADYKLQPVPFLMSYAVAISAFGSLNGSILTSSRLFFVAARDGLMPKALSFVNVNYHTPIISVLFEGVITIIMLFVGDLYLLINYCIFAEYLFIGLSIIALLVTRYRSPNDDRPIRIWIGLPILFLITCTFIVITSVIESPRDCGMGLLIMLAGIPIYILMRIVQKSKYQKKYDHVATVVDQVIQKTFLTVYDEQECLAISPHPSMLSIRHWTHHHET
ncbi:hypothetical protein SNEBB_005969 [Seison nebaliae]|nr:hypothetical protein SNEBB_005969 [Seison nebaliae]